MINSDIVIVVNCVVSRYVVFISLIDKYCVVIIIDEYIILRLLVVGGYFVISVILININIIECVVII